MNQDIFQRQEEVRRQSRRFFTSFAASVALAVVVFYFMITGCLITAGFLFGVNQHRLAAPVSVIEALVEQLPRSVYGSPPRVLAPRPFFMVGLGVVLIIASACFYKIRAIKNGGGFYVAVMLGGRLLEKPETFKERQLVNVVEEMALAAGLPRPEIFIMDQEPGINAVTAGLEPEDAVISVTAGALEHLDRDELQGVVAHEFAHILNGDCALNLTMTGWLYGLLVFHVAGRSLLSILGRGRVRSSGKGGQGLLIILAVGLILMVGGWVGKLFAELVQAALSRTREYLADAGAAQFTRNPQGLAGALKKIAAFPQTLVNGHSLAVKSFFIASPVKGWSLFRTHPPIPDRIWALAPDWDGELPVLDLPPPEAKAEALPPETKAEALTRAIRKTAVLSASEVKKAASASSSAAAKRLAEQLKKLPLDWSGLSLLTLVGEPAGPPQGLAAAGRRLLESLPGELRAAALDPAGAPALMAAVFLQNEDPATAAKQTGLIREVLGAEAARKAAELSLLMDLYTRLPLLSLASPVLRRLPDKEKLGRLVKALIVADGRLSLFEVAAAQVLKKSLGLKLGATPAAAPPLDFIRQLQGDVALLLSALAHAGADDPLEAEAAFKAATAHFSNQWPPLPFRPRNEIKTRDLPPVLDRLAQAPGQIKARLTAAAVTSVYYDQKVTPGEYELGRALAAALDRPLPLKE